MGKGGTQLLLHDSDPEKGGPNHCIISIGDAILCFQAPDNAKSNSVMSLDHFHAAVYKWALP